MIACCGDFHDLLLHDLVLHDLALHDLLLHDLVLIMSGLPKGGYQCQSTIVKVTNFWSFIIYLLSSIYTYFYQLILFIYLFIHPLTDLPCLTVKSN